MLKSDKKISQNQDKDTLYEAEQENRVFSENKHEKRNNLARFMNLRVEDKKPSKKDKNQEGPISDNQNAISHADNIVKKLRDSRKKHEMFINHKRNSLPSIIEPSKLSMDTNCNSSTSINTLVSNTLHTHASNILTTESLQRKNSDVETKEKRVYKIMRQLSISNNTLLSPKRNMTPQQKPVGLISHQILKKPDSGKKQPVSRNYMNSGVIDMKTMSDTTAPSAYNTISNSEVNFEKEKEKYLDTRQERQDNNSKNAKKKENSRNVKTFHSENLESQTADPDLQSLGIDLPKLKGITRSLLKQNSMQQNLNNYEKGPRIMNIVNNLNPKTTDKKVEINFNQYEIKIVPEKKNSNFLKNNHNNFNNHNHHDNRDQALMSQSELDSEADSSMSSVVPTKIEKTESQINVNSYKEKPKPTPSKFDNRDKHSVKQPITKKMSMNPRSNEIKSPTKIVINKSQKNTIVVSFNNNENMENLKLNVNKMNEDNSVSISFKNNLEEMSNTNMKDDKSGNKSDLEDNHSSDSSLEEIKKNKKQFLSRAVEMKEIPENEEHKEMSVTHQADSNLDQVIMNETQSENKRDSPLMEINHEEPNMQMEEKEEDFTFKKDHDFRYRQSCIKPTNKNFMRQLSRISEISNYFSRADELNNSFESIPLQLKKLKFGDKNNEETEEMELHRGLQHNDFEEHGNLIEEEKDAGNSNNSSQEETQTQNHSQINMTDNHNESKRDVYLQIVTEHSNSHNYKSDDSIFNQGLVTSYQKEDISGNSSSESATSEIRIHPKRTFNSSKNILRPVRRESSLKSFKSLNIQHSKTLPNDFQFASLDDESEILSEQVKLIIERLEKDIDTAQDEFLERASKHINEYCEKLLYKNFNKHKVKKVYRRLQWGICDLLIRSTDLFSEQNMLQLDEFENLEAATRNVRVMVEKDYSKNLTDTYFDVNPFERIFCDTDFQRDLESSPNSKNTLLANFRKSEERKLRMLATFRRRSVAQSEHFLNRSMRSSLMVNHSNLLQNLSPEKSDKSEKKHSSGERFSPQTPKSQQRSSISMIDYFKMNQAIAFIRLGANNLVYANKFLNLDQWQKETVETLNPLVNEVKKVNWRVGENDKIELVVNRGLVAPVKKRASISLFNTNINTLLNNLSETKPAFDSKKSVIQLIPDQSGESEHQDDEDDKASKNFMKFLIIFFSF
jgi:virulence-associated protein VagC